MSQLPILDPALSPYLERSTKTKPTEFYLPSLNLTPEEEREQNNRFLNFLNNTIEGDTFIQRSAIEHQQNKDLGEWYKMQEDWYSQLTRANPNNTDKVLESWRMDRRETPLLSISVAPDGFGPFQPKKLATLDGSWDNTDYFTFAGGSTWGALLSKDNAAPYFVELLGRNAQTNHFAAIRARGGRNGELWQTVTAKSPWLARMFTESTSTKEQIDSWIESTPSLVNIKASIPFSAYGGDTMMDVLADAPVPEGQDGWDPKRAIEELKTNDPILSDILFRQMGVTEERLIELGKNPIQFKFYIADAIDNYAYTSYLSEYAQVSGGFVNFANTMAWPLVRDSFNSNDNFSEVLAIAGGLVATSTIVGAEAGIPAVIGGALSFVAKPFTIAKNTLRAYDKYESISKNLARAGRINKVIWQSQKLLPSNLTNTIFDSTGITKKFFTSAKDASRTRKVFTYGLKQFVGEGAQGVVESVVNQREAIENGLQERFYIGDLAYNALEEGIGGLALGGAIRLTGRSAAKLTTTKVGEFVNKKIGEAKANAISIVTEKVSDDASRNIRLATSIVLGIPDGVDFDTYKNAIETELRLNAVLDRVNKTTGFGDILTPGARQNPLLDGLVSILSNGNSAQDFGARVEILRRIDAAIEKTTDSTTGKSNLTGEDVEALFVLTGLSATEANPAARTKFIEAIWLSKQFSNGKKTNDKGQPLSITDATDKEIEEVMQEIDVKINSFATKLGASSTDEIETVYGRSIGEKEDQTLKSVIQEEQDLLNEADEPKNISIDMGNLPLEGTVPNELSSSQETQDTFSTEYESKTKPEAAPEVVTPKSSVAVLTESILDGLNKPDAMADSDVTLTPEEEENLRSRTCNIEGN